MLVVTNSILRKSKEGLRPLCLVPLANAHRATHGAPPFHVAQGVMAIGNGLARSRCNPEKRGILRVVPVIDLCGLNVPSHGGLAHGHFNDAISGKGESVAAGLDDVDVSHG